MAERLENIRRLMEFGAYGKLESVIPPITIPAWMCMATSQDPGSLGVYGFRNRTDRGYGGLAFATSRSVRVPRVWDLAGQRDPDDDGVFVKEGELFTWKGEASLAFPAYGGVLHFDTGEPGMAPDWLRAQDIAFQARAAVERARKKR